MSKRSQRGSSAHAAPDPKWCCHCLRAPLFALAENADGTAAAKATLAPLRTITTTSVLTPVQ
eukprot:4102957-Lingulodinium_polyedra.AAC.1